MARGQDPKTDDTKSIESLEIRIKALELFCSKLIDSLLEAEKSKTLKEDEVYLLPEGVYFGKTIK